MESISTIGIISSSCTISQDEFDIMELDIKSEVFDEFVWKNLLYAVFASIFIMRRPRGEDTLFVSEN